jgi:hypothetical protein
MQSEATVLTPNHLDLWLSWWPVANVLLGTLPNSNSIISSAHESTHSLQVLTLVALRACQIPARSIPEPSNAHPTGSCLQGLGEESGLAI